MYLTGDLHGLYAELRTHVFFSISLRFSLVHISGGIRLLKTSFTGVFFQANLPSKTHAYCNVVCKL